MCVRSKLLVIALCSKLCCLVQGRRKVWKFRGANSNLGKQLPPAPRPLHSGFRRLCCLDLYSLALVMAKAPLLSNLHFKRLGSNAASSRGDYLLLILRESFILPCLAWELEKLGIVPCSTYPKPLVQNKDWCNFCALANLQTRPGFHPITLIVVLQVQSTYISFLVCLQLYYLLKSNRIGQPWVYNVYWLEFQSRKKFYVPIPLFKLNIFYFGLVFHVFFLHFIVVYGRA